MRNKFIQLISISILFSLVSACQQNSLATPTQKEVTKVENMSNADKPPSTNNKTQWLVATINYMEFEGGFYGIVTKAGSKLLPINLAKKYRQHGLLIEVQGYEAEGVMTIHQWGKPFKITNIKLPKAQ